MELDYDSHASDRVYDFYCQRCSITVRVFEAILWVRREGYSRNGDSLEPLTKEEKQDQYYERKAIKDLLITYGPLAKGKKKDVSCFLRKAKFELQTIPFNICQKPFRVVRGSSVRQDVDLAGRPETMEPRLEPDECLGRRCRMCGLGMVLDYDFDSMDRHYAFHCTKCGTTVHLTEEIFEEMRQAQRELGWLVEPLAKRERSGRAVIMNGCKRLLKNFGSGKPRLEDGFKKQDEVNRLSSDEAEKLR
jgi:hypothetical protein